MRKLYAGDSYEDALIDKIREMTEVIVLEDQIARHPERFANDHRAATIRARMELGAKAQRKSRTVFAGTRAKSI